MSGVVLSWSGGKDSALALWALREEQGVEPTALLTTFTEDYGRVSMHAVRRELLEAQAAAVGVPLVEVGIPAVCSNEVYEERMAAALAAPPLAGVEEVAFADLFLADIRAYREECLAAIGRRASFPVWGRETAALAARFIDAGFEATLVCVDPRQIDASFCGRAFDAELLRDLPAGADPCGENGEFHTFVTAGPIFSAPVATRHGETVERDGFVFHDLLPV
ncbi:MAG TPA: ATP-binding protein [Solirubrobacterales bacterium]